MALLKNYCPPEVEIVKLSLEGQLCQSGESQVLSTSIEELGRVDFNWEN
jgi:hypothetical protein